jgi:hypothetical protein
MKPLGCFHKQVDWFSSLEVQVSSIVLNNMDQNKSIYMCESLFGQLESQDNIFRKLILGVLFNNGANFFSFFFKL